MSKKGKEITKGQNQTNQIFVKIQINKMKVSILPFLSTLSIIFISNLQKYPSASFLWNSMRDLQMNIFLNLARCTKVDMRSMH